MMRDDRVWQSAEVAQGFLDGMRGAIPLAGEQLDVMLRVIAATQQNVGSFLDIGCGDGVLGRAIAARYPEARGVLLDFSEPMIAAARAKAENSSHLAFVVQDYGDPAWIHPLADYAPFDVIVSGYSIHHQPDARKIELYREIFHLLKPGGLFINIEHIAPMSAWDEELFSQIFIDAMQVHYERIGQPKSRAEVSDEYYNRPHKDANILAPLDIQCEWLRQIGYTDVDCFLKIFELAVFGGLRPPEKI